MKEEKKAKEMREKIKERINKKSNDQQEGMMSQKIERIGSYNVALSDPIGQGSYGKVYKAKTDDGELLACKIISKARLENLKLYDESYASEMETRFRTESQFHKQLSGCSNVVKLIETIENNKAYYFIMQYCESDLSKIIKQNGILTQEVALKYFSEMLEGYKSIYEKNAFHRDLKPENLLIKDDVVKISDFGFVKIFDDMDIQCKSGKNKLRTQSKVGSIKYMAPDVLSLAMTENENDLKTYNAQKCDMWSMGIILYKMLYGKEPFNGKNEEQMMKKINQKDLHFPDTVELSPEIIRNAKVSPQIKKIIKKMINKDQSSRITFKKLYSTIKSYMKAKQVQKMASGIRQDDDKQRKEGEAKNKKEELLIFYNKMITKLYHDATNYATLEEIGVPNFYETTFKLICHIHQLRTTYLQSQKKGEKYEEISANITQQVSVFHNTFYNEVKAIAKNDKPNEVQPTMQALLLTIYQRIKIYPQFQELVKEVSVFLIDLLLLLSLQLKIVKPDYVYTWTIRCDNYKQKVILNYKQNTMTMLERKINNKEEQPQEVEQEKHKKKRDKTREKDKKHRSKGKDKEKDSTEDQQPQKKQKSKEKHKDRSSRQKRPKK